MIVLGLQAEQDLGLPSGPSGGYVTVRTRSDDTFLCVSSSTLASNSSMEYQGLRRCGANRGKHGRLLIRRLQFDFGVFLTAPGVLLNFECSLCAAVE